MPTIPSRILSLSATAVFLLAAVPFLCAQNAPETTTTQVPIVFSGGHETDPRDKGRPVILIAAALGVPPEVFREAFSHVHPAGAGNEPEPDQVRKNKEALLSALGPYGVTNDRLDTVSNYYRYNKSKGEFWPIKAATAYAIVKNGIVTSFVIKDGGSGYSSPPTIAAPDLKGAAATVQLAFSKNFEENGAVSSISLAPAPSQP